MASVVLEECQKCGHYLAYDSNEIYCPLCRRSTVKQISYTCPECGCDLVYGGRRYNCPQCWLEGDDPYPQEGRVESKGAQYDPLKHFRFWMTHILGVEPVSELRDANRLLEKIKLLMTRDKISAPSVGDCSRWLKELRRNRLYKNASLILKLLREDELPPIDQCVIKRAELMFCSILRMREKLELCGNRHYYPFYIYKIFNEISDGEQRWVLSHIHLQIEKIRKCEIEWRDKI